MFTLEIFPLAQPPSGSIHPSNYIPWQTWQTTVYHRTHRRAQCANAPRTTSVQNLYFDCQGLNPTSDLDIFQMSTFLLCFAFESGVSYNLGWPQTLYNQRLPWAFLILLGPPPTCLDQRHASPHPVYGVLEIEPGSFVQATQAFYQPSYISSLDVHRRSVRTVKG